MNGSNDFIVPVDMEYLIGSKIKPVVTARIMAKTKKQSPPNIIRPYFIPLRSSLTPFRHMEVKVYVTVSIEKIPPIY